MFKIIFSILLLLTLTSSHAEIFNTKELIVLSGKNKNLSKDEGYLFLNLKTNNTLSSITIRPVKKGNKIYFTSISKGDNIALIKLKSGEYYWNKLNLNYKGVKFEKNFDKSKHVFSVEAGIINYPGSWKTDITLYQRKLASIGFMSENRFSTDLESLNQQFPQYIKDYQISYQGVYEDPFPEYFSEIKNNSKNLTSPLENQHLFDINDGVLAEVNTFKQIKHYLEDDNQSYARLNPNGKFVVFRSVVNGITKIEVINTSSFKSVTIFNEKLPKTSVIKRITWIDEDSIYFQAINKTHPFNQIVHLTINKQIITAANHINIPLNGDLIDPLIQQGNKVLFSNPFNTQTAIKGLFKVDTSNQKQLKKSLKHTHTRKKMFNDADFWLTDSQGALRLILTSEYNNTNDDYNIDYWYLTKTGTKKWRKIKSYSSFSDIEPPVALSNDDNYIYVLSENFGDKKSIHKYSTKDFSYAGVFFEDETIDVEGVISGNKSQSINGVFFYQDGFIKYKYFNQSSELLKSLQDNNPNLQLYLIGQNTNLNINLIYGINEYTKGSWYINNQKEQTLLKFSIDDKQYDQLEKGDFYHLKIKSKDDIDIEGYLVMPSNKDLSKVPLIVNPHGGPIGTRDFAYTNDIQHFYASQGFATLKVNYRGSSGYGKNFKQLGHKQRGENIESDINEMVDYVIQNFNVSDSKICTMGSSYGGYSAIMLTILYPERYQCAVSFAGVSDIPLLYTSSDFKENDHILEKFAEITGDPLENLPLLKSKSPVYLVNKITKPILLFHGLNDERVTIEHSYRLNNSLNLSGKKSKLIILNNEAHGMIHKESKITYVAKALEFIKKQL